MSHKILTSILAVQVLDTLKLIFSVELVRELTYGGPFKHERRLRGVHNAMHYTDKVILAKPKCST
jgi:hypothetical protein